MSDIKKEKFFKNICRFYEKSIVHSNCIYDSERVNVCCHIPCPHFNLPCVVKCISIPKVNQSSTADLVSFINETLTKASKDIAKVSFSNKLGKITADKIRGNNTKFFIVDDLLPKDTYTFRGKTIIEKVIYDCIKDKKNAFIIIEKDTAYFGINRLTMLRTDHENYYENNPILHLDKYIHEPSHSPFYVYEIKKEEINAAIDFIKKEIEKIKSIDKFLLKKVKKQNKSDDKKGIKRETVEVKVF